MMFVVSPDLPCQEPIISVIVISFNTCEMTLRCLEDVHADLRGLDAEVLVVDNASSDGSADAIATRFPSVKLVRNETNVGFGTANNQALGMAKGKFVMMLNTDAFVHPGCCEALVAFARTQPKAGVVGARLLNKDGSVQISCFPFPSPFRAWIENLWIPKLLPRSRRFGDYRQWAHDTLREVDWVVGACLLCRREVIGQVGGFDPLFFMYSEETDWQKRIRGAGWKIYFTPEAVATHLGGASGTLEPEIINRYFFTSLDLYELKHHGIAGFLLVRAAMVAGLCLRLPAWMLIYLFRPCHRVSASSKIKKYLWILRRQLGSGFPENYSRALDHRGSGSAA